jgi:hypothetical protein
MAGKQCSWSELAEVLTPWGPEPSPSVLLPVSDLGLRLSRPLRHSGVHVHLVPVTHEGTNHAPRFHPVNSDSPRSVVVVADLLGAAAVAVAGPVWWPLARRSIPLIALAADIATVLLRCGLEVVPLLSEDTEATAASIMAIARPVDGRVVLVGGRRTGPRLAEDLRKRGLRVRVISFGALDGWDLPGRPASGRPWPTRSFASPPCSRRETATTCSPCGRRPRPSAVAPGGDGQPSHNDGRRPARVRRPGRGGRADGCEADGGCFRRTRLIP